jgi:hypothetical protein
MSETHLELKLIESATMNFIRSKAYGGNAFDKALNT